MYSIRAHVYVNSYIHELLIVLIVALSSLRLCELAQVIAYLMALLMVMSHLASFTNFMHNVVMNITY